MRFLHIADTHLGFQAYSKLDDTGINQRESDCYSAFNQSMDIAIEEKVDFVLHAGDLFHKIRPSNRTISQALAGISKLAQEDIPFLVISGNHSTPRLRETGSVFRIFDFFPKIHSIYKSRYETIEMNDCHLHLIPHCISSQALLEELHKVKMKNGKNVLSLHAGIIGIDVFRMGDLNEVLVTPGDINMGADYVALGHYHKFTNLFDRVYYSGSTERLSFSEVDGGKGVILVDESTQRFIPLHTRGMVDLAPIDCDGMDERGVIDSATEKLQNLDGKIVRLTLRNLDRNVYRTLDFRKIKELGKDALHLELRRELQAEKNLLPERSSIGDLGEEIRDFWARRGDKNKNFDALLKLALKYLDEGQR